MGTLLTLILIVGIIAVVVGGVLAIMNRPWQGPVVGGVVLIVLYIILTYVLH